MALATDAEPQRVVGGCASDRNRIILFTIVAGTLALAQLFHHALPRGRSKQRENKRELDSLPAQPNSHGNASHSKWVQPAHSAKMIPTQRAELGFKHIGMYRRRPSVGPKGQQRGGAAVGPACGAARGPARSVARRLGV